MGWLLLEKTSQLEADLVWVIQGQNGPMGMYNTNASNPFNVWLRPERLRTMSKEIRELLEEASSTMLDMANAWVNHWWVASQTQGKRLHHELSKAWKKYEQALTLLGKQPEAGEFTETDNLVCELGQQDAEIKRLKKVIDRQAEQLDYQGKIGSQQFEAQRIEIEQLRERLAAAKKDIAKLKEKDGE